LPLLDDSSIDRSGLWLVWRNGAVVVRAVDRGSPADAAGIIGGDTIVVVDGKPATDLDIVRSQFVGSPGQSVKVTYQRGTRRADVTLALRNLI
jgi:C-terminal processing protease CtpA/Prc